MRRGVIAPPLLFQPKKNKHTMKPILRYYLTEINLGTTQPGNGQNINFTDYAELRDIYITGIEAFDNDQVAVSPSGKIVVNVLTGITLTLLDVFNQEVIKNYPTYDLNPTNVAGFYRDIMPFPLQLTKSYISILDNTGLAASESIIFNIFYVKKADWPKYRAQYVRQ
jgi:hypothetical protein